LTYNSNLTVRAVTLYPYVIFKERCCSLDEQNIV
jgi:hypothetical protein